MPADTSTMTAQEVADLKAFNAQQAQDPEMQRILKILNDDAAFAAELAKSKAAEDAAIARGEVKQGSLGTFANSPGVLPATKPASGALANVQANLSNLTTKVPGGTTTVAVAVVAAAALITYLVVKNAKPTGGGASAARK